MSLCCRRLCCCCCGSGGGCCSGDNVQPSTPQFETPSVGNLLIFVNPKSGAGHGVEDFKKKLAPKLKAKNVKYELIVTGKTHEVLTNVTLEGPGHARSIVKARNDLYLFNAIIICSGDGLIFEVINGMVERPDRAEIVPKLPIGIVPSGSGNALLASVMYSRKLPIEDGPFQETASEIIPNLDACAFPVNLLHIETPDQHFASFLSIGWGLLGDIDIESEKFRRLFGSGRFFVGAILRILNLRTYRGRLSFLESGPSEPAQAEAFRVYETTMPPPFEAVVKEPDFNSRPRKLDDDNKEELGDFWETRHLPGYGQIPRLNEDVPENWTIIKDEFLFVYAMSLSHISNKGCYTPQAGLVDDRIYLTYVLKKDVTSRIALTKFLDSIESGSKPGECQEFDFFKIIPVKSFRLEPHDPGSYIVVDGENIDCKRIQATVTNLNMAVMGR